jgi:hypothetical protein
MTLLRLYAFRPALDDDSASREPRSPRDATDSA